MKENVRFLKEGKRLQGVEIRKIMEWFRRKWKNLKENGKI